MENNKIIILGLGHLSIRAKKKFQEIGYDVQNIYLDFNSIKNNGSEVSKFDSIRDLLEEANFSHAKAVFILDHDDTVNIELSLIINEINSNIPVFVSLFNESLGGHLKKINTNLNIFNPAAISATFFADILKDDLEPPEFDFDSFFDPIIQKTRFQFDKVLTLLFLFIFLFFGLGVSFFKYMNHMSWIDSFYFTTVTISTVGYGDFSLKDSPAFVKLLGASFMLSSMILVWVFFSFFIDWLLRKRREIELGVRKYKLKNHILICGLGRMGYQLASEFVNRGREVLVIESNIEVKHLEAMKAKGVKVFIGDATVKKNLVDAGLENASGFFVLINDDIKNLEVGLMAMSLRKNNMPIVLRIFDEELAKSVRQQLKFRFAYSTTAVTADYLVGLFK